MHQVAAGQRWQELSTTLLQFENWFIRMDDQKGHASIRSATRFLNGQNEAEGLPSISRTSVRNIISQDLGENSVQRVKCHGLTDEQKERRCERAGMFLTEFGHEMQVMFVINRSCLVGDLFRRKMVADIAPIEYAQQQSVQAKECHQGSNGSESVENDL